MRDGTELIRNQPTQRLNMVTDFYRLLLDRLLILLCSDVILLFYSIYLCCHYRSSSEQSKWIAWMYGEWRNFTDYWRYNCDWNRSISFSLIFSLFLDYWLFLLFVFVLTKHNCWYSFYCLVSAESYAYALICDCRRMGIGTKMSRRSDSRYDWEYFEDDYGLSFFIFLLFYKAYSLVVSDILLYYILLIERKQDNQARRNGSVEGDMRERWWIYRSD